MGRKIPAKKHRGVKDPEKQHQKREAELKDKINAPPTNPDDQPIPRTLQRIMELQNKIKNKPIFKKKKKKRSKLISVETPTPKLHPKAKPEKAVPIFKQRPNENPWRFMNRVNRETEAFLKETAFEKKYKVEVKRNPETGHISGIEKSKKDDLDELMKLQSKHKNVNKKKKVNNDETKCLTKSQKRRQKLLEKKQKKVESHFDDDVLVKREKIAFGEIAHAPPEIVVRPKNADKNVAKPGERKLLLKEMLEKEKSLQNKKSSKSSVINKSGKRKDLPIAERRKLEEQQSKVIAAYRLLKAAKMKM